MVHASVQGNQQYDVHVGVADHSAHPAGDRLRLLGVVDDAGLDDRACYVLPQ